MFYGSDFSKRLLMKRLRLDFIMPQCVRWDTLPIAPPYLSATIASLPRFKRQICLLKSTKSLALCPGLCKNNAPRTQRMPVLFSVACACCGGHTPPFHCTDTAAQFLSLRYRNIRVRRHSSQRRRYYQNSSARLKHPGNTGNDCRY